MSKHTLISSTHQPQIHAKKTLKEKCEKCRARKIAREEIIEMYMPPMPMPPIPMPMMNQNQLGHNFLHGCGYGDWSNWEDKYPAIISNKQWKDHMKTAQNACDSAQENGKKIGDVQSAITNEIKEAHKAIKETHASVNNTDIHLQDTRAAIDMAHASIRSNIQKTQDVIHDKHAEQMSKQEECAADVARVRQLLEEEAKKREDARRVQEMVQYAQSQGLLQTQQDRDRDRHRHSSRSSRSSSPTTSSSFSTSSSSSSRTCEHGRRARAEEEQKHQQEAERRRQWERKLEQQQHVQYSEAMRGITDTRLRLQEEQERWSRAEGELEFLRRRDSYFHNPRLQGPFYDDAVEPPPYPYVDFAIGHRGVRGPRRAPPRCGNGRVWDC
ncbi:hypothetical protein GGS24DRAFT_60205 [Hypoxylon argillaceum]|nr:hypothetical protein GGS24DRAFT_60205 [Hypoxylon argillaceum]